MAAVKKSPVATPTTLLDYFAGQAIVGALDGDVDKTARKAYVLARAMVAERRKLKK